MRIVELDVPLLALGWPVENLRYFAVSKLWGTVQEGGYALFVGQGFATFLLASHIVNRALIRKTPKCIVPLGLWRF